MKLFKKSVLAAAVFAMVFPTSSFAATQGLDSFPDPVDKESWTLPEHMTWEDYNPIPGIDWATSDIEPTRNLRGALILVDFPDQGFIVTQEEGSDLAGNPVGVGSMPREDVPEFYNNLLSVPSELNNYQTIDTFWKENSHGEWGVTLDAFGPYQLEKNEFQYGLSGSSLPPGYSGGNLFSDGVAVAANDINASGNEYDFAFIIHASYDESGVWQEFGEMKFQDRDSIPDEFGPPRHIPGFENMPNWAPTRYVPWTSYFAAKNIWSAASSARIGDKTIRVSHQGENDGMAVFAHEFGHLQGLLDNYNNAMLDPRTYSGYWETMSRGAFGGPGGTHTRWMIPATLGASLPAPHTLRNKIKQGFLSDDQVVRVDRDELATTGPVFADVIARQVPVGEKFGRTGIHGINITMTDRTPTNYLAGDWRNDMIRGAYNNYTLEVIDQVGADSFATDSGVLIAKTKNAESAPNVWVVDSHPEDINIADFILPDGTEKMITKGDPRQLADALFHAGDGEALTAGVFDGTIDGDTVVSEYIDPHNKLHFYVLDKNYDDEGVLSYRVAVRHLDGAGNFERGVEAGTSSSKRAVEGKVATHTFSVTNTGEATDLFRIEASTEAGWETRLQHNVIEVEAGQTVEVPVYVAVPEGEAPTTLNFTATSETDNSKVATASDALLSEVTIANVSTLVDMLAANGEIDASAVRPLTLHLTALAQFERTGQTAKVNKHIDGFKVLVHHHADNGSVSDSAASALVFYAELLKK